MPNDRYSYAVVSLDKLIRREFVFPAKRGDVAVLAMERVSDARSQRKTREWGQKQLWSARSYGSSMATTSVGAEGERNSTGDDSGDHACSPALTRPWAAQRAQSRRLQPSAAPCSTLCDNSARRRALVRSAPRARARAP